MKLTKIKVENGEYQGVLCPGMEDGEHWACLTWQASYGWCPFDWLYISDEYYENHKNVPGNKYRQVWLLTEQQKDSREARCHSECQYYYADIIPSSALEWFHKGVEIGAKWVDNGDKIII